MSLAPVPGAMPGGAQDTPIANIIKKPIEAETTRRSFAIDLPPFLDLINAYALYKAKLHQNDA
jgi:hypothetical protein